jgi:hypothetical protein
MADMDSAIKRRSAMLIGMPFRPINLNGTAAVAARAMGLLLYAGIAFSSEVLVQIIQMLTLQRIGD